MVKKKCAYKIFIETHYIMFHIVWEIFMFTKEQHNATGSSVSNTNYGELLNFINYNANKNGFFPCSLCL